MRAIPSMLDDMAAEEFVEYVRELPDFNKPNRPRVAARLLQIAARRAKDGDPDLSQFYTDQGESLRNYTNAEALEAFPLPEGY